MTGRDPRAHVERVQSRVATVLGTAMGLLMCVYFFTFAEVINRGWYGVLWFQVGSSLVMVALLFRLQRLARALTRLWLGRRPEYRQVFEERRG